MWRTRVVSACGIFDEWNVHCAHSHMCALKVKPPIGHESDQSSVILDESNKKNLNLLLFGWHSTTATKKLDIVDYLQYVSTASTLTPHCECSDGFGSVKIMPFDHNAINAWRRQRRIKWLWKYAVYPQWYGARTYSISSNLCGRQTLFDSNATLNASNWWN